MLANPAELLINVKMIKQVLLVLFWPKKIHRKTFFWSKSHFQFCFNQFWRKHFVWFRVRRGKKRENIPLARWGVFEVYNQRPSGRQVDALLKHSISTAWIAHAKHLFVFYQLNTPWTDLGSGVIALEMINFSFGMLHSISCVCVCLRIALLSRVLYFVLSFLFWNKLNRVFPFWFLFLISKQHSSNALI